MASGDRSLPCLSAVLRARQCVRKIFSACVNCGSLSLSLSRSATRRMQPLQLYRSTNPYHNTTVSATKGRHLESASTNVTSVRSNFSTDSASVCVSARLGFAAVVQKTGSVLTNFEKELCNRTWKFLSVFFSPKKSRRNALTL